MRTVSLAALLVLVASLCPPAAQAHIAMTSPAPRSADQKAGPCGAAGSTRGTKVTNFQPGETIMVEWNETVDHPGHYRIAFDDDGNDVFMNPNNPDDNFAFTLVEPIADKAGGHYTQAVTLPTTPCDNCTLQLMQIMTTSVPYNSFYYQCADITIGGSGSGSGSGSGDPGPGDSGGCSSASGGGLGAMLVVLGSCLVTRRKRR